jgi:hypothetical protein
MHLALSWNSEISISDLVGLFAIFLAVATALFAYRQLRLAQLHIDSARIQLAETSRTNKATFLADVFKWYLTDKELRDIFYRLDYGRWEFDPDTFPLSDSEPAIDHLLYLYNVIGYYTEVGVIAEQELPIIIYEANRVLHNPEIVKYLEWLDGKYDTMGIPGTAYPYARTLTRRISA